MCLHGIESRVLTPHVHVPKNNLFTGCFKITTFPKEYLLDIIFWQTLHSYDSSRKRIVIVKSRALISWNTSSYLTVPYGVRKLSLDHALAHCLLNCLHSSVIKRIHAFNGSTAVLARILQLAAFINSTAADVLRWYM